MYLRKLNVKNLRLIRELNLDFLHEDKPRQFTAFIGESGRCKSTLLRAINLTAGGHTQANRTSEVARFTDGRLPGSETEMRAWFSFGNYAHQHRCYPGWTGEGEPPRIVSTVRGRSGYNLFYGGSAYYGQGSCAPKVTDPLKEARAQKLAHWLSVGYAGMRLLGTERGATGACYADLLSGVLPGRLVGHLHQVFVLHQVLPGIRYIAVPSRTMGSDDEPQRLPFPSLQVTTDFTGGMAVPVAELSQGYRETLWWIADLIGREMLDAQWSIGPEEMEGLCLVDDLGTHLHPKQQMNIVRGLKEAFPRIQFVVTTNAPVIASQLEQHELICLEQDEGGNVVARKATESPLLMTGSEILRSFFGIDHCLPRELDAMICRYGYLSCCAQRTEDEEQEMRVAVETLSSHSIDITGKAPADSK